MSDDVKTVAQEILDRAEGRIGTHSTDCHKYHLACFAAFVMRNLAASEQTPDFSALLSDEAVLAGVIALREMGPETLAKEPADDWEIAQARAALQAAVDAVTKAQADGR